MSIQRTDGTQTDGLPRPRIALQIAQVCARYGKKPILRDLSLTVAEGEVVVLIGANGAGKSTVLRTVIGLLRPDAGSVRFYDEDITRLSVRQRVRGGVAYLMQGGPIFPSLSVHQNLQMGALTVRAAERAAAIQETLALFPLLQGKRSQRAGLLSGGERQALALCMTLVQRPKLLLVDEPSVGLSPSLAAAALETIRRVSEQRRTAVLLVEQRVKEALQVASRAVLLAEGAIAAETDTPCRWQEEGVLDAYFFGKTRLSAKAN